jgi:hypothetical protein
MISSLQHTVDSCRSNFNSTMSNCMPDLPHTAQPR